MSDTQLRLEIGLRGTKSIITDSYFTSPLKLGTPNMEGDRLKVVLMMASAGILKGDSFVYSIHCQPHTKLLLTEQSYTKIFQTGDVGAKRVQKIQIGEGASLYYQPCATIPFAGSRFDNSLNVDMSRDSEFVYTDIVTAGRVGMGECFLYTHFSNRVTVCVEGRPVWIDNCLLEPQSMDVENMIFFDGFTHQGVLYYYGDSKKEALLLQHCYEKSENIVYGVSRALKGVCVRALSDAAQNLEEFFEQLKEYSGIL